MEEDELENYYNLIEPDLQDQDDFEDYVDE